MKRGTRTRMCSIHSLSIVYHCVALAVQCETTHGVYEFRRGFCTLVLSFPSVTVMESLVQVTVVAGPPVEIQVRVN